MCVRMIVVRAVIAVTFLPITSMAQEESIKKTDQGSIISIDNGTGDITIKTDSGKTLKICDVYHYFGQVSEGLEISIPEVDFAARIKNFSDFKVGDRVEISYRTGHTELDSFEKAAQQNKATEKTKIIQGTIEHFDPEARQLIIVKETGEKESLTIAKDIVVMAGEQKVSPSVLKKGMNATVTYVEEEGEPDPHMGVPIILVAKRVGVDASVKDEPAAPPRFVDNNDGTVTDTKTKLMWQKEDNGKAVTFVEAKAYCTNLKLGGHTDWRLPKEDEKDVAIVTELIMPRHSKEMPADFYWSDDATTKLAFNFLPSHVLVSDIHRVEEGTLAYVRTVRTITENTKDPNSQTRTLSKLQNEANEPTQLINDKISELQQGMFTFWKACSVIPHKNFREENVKVPDTTPKDDLVGIAVKFEKEWGGWGSEEKVTKEETVLFRKGMVGKCKAIPSYVKDGTEAKIKGKIYIFKNGKWQVSQ